jgi:hypothetical protein
VKELMEGKGSGRSSSVTSVDESLKKAQTAQTKGHHQPGFRL